MSVVSIFSRREQSAPAAAGEADRLLQTILEDGDVVGRDPTGRMVIQLAVQPLDFDRLMAFGADAAECEDGGDDEPYECPPMSSCWYWEEAGARFVGPDDLVPPKRLRRASRVARAVALALLLVTVPRLEARADQTSIVAPLPRSTATAESLAQCCRICTKGQACGDGCISAKRQCRKESGCACSAPAAGS